MEKIKPQSFQNHARYVPGFHIFVFGVFVVNFVRSLVELRHGIGFGSVMAVLTAFAMLMLFFYVRQFPLAVQDRIIRTEMQLRMERLLPLDLRPRIADFTVGQLISLRFAGDDELPALARQVLDEKLAAGKPIKSRIKNWQPDYMRS